MDHNNRLNHKEHHKINDKEAETMSKHEHLNHHQMMIDDFKRRFFVSLFLSLPVVIFSPMVQSLLGFNIIFFGRIYVLFAIASIIYFYGGWPFLKGLYGEVKEGTPGMMTLIALAITVAFVYSSAVVFGFKGKLFFWELATLIDIMLLGHWIEMRSVIGASKALEKLSELLPDSAHVIIDGVIIEKKVKELSAGDIMLIKPGEKIPADGILIKGDTYIDESMLTGESKPVHKKNDEKVIAGSINGSGSVEVKIIHVGEDSYLSKVIKLVQDAQSVKSKTQHLADKAAKYLTYISITVGIFTLAGWLFVGKDLIFAIERMATVMIITCPHALGLAIPLVVAVSTAQSAKHGLLIRNRTAFELSRNISIVVFDKTGTLTKGDFGVTNIGIINLDYTKEQIIQYAASIENRSEHPIAQGLIKEAAEKSIVLLNSDNVSAIKGKGVTGIVANKEVSVVSPGYLKESKIEIENDIKRTNSGTIVYLMIDKKVISSITLSDTVRDESKEAIRKLQGKGIKCWMLTGDNKEAAESVAEILNLDGYFAEVLPHEKQEKISELQSKGEVVAMTGDGVNDAPALAMADVGIAIGSGTDVAAETADIILVNSNPMDVSSLILFGRATYNKMVQNLIWATAYNIIAIPLAAGVLYSYGIVISPAIGAVLMSISTIVVAINAKLLKLNNGG